MTATRAVTVLGTGIMGAGMARNLARAGLDVTAWNRSVDKARPLAEEGVTVAEDAAEAVAGADVVVTMLFDVDSVAEVMGRALDALPEPAVWAQTSTVGIAGTERLAELADKHGTGFVDAPVLGTRQPAEEGKLVVLAAGPVEPRERVAPVFDAVGVKTVWVGERPGDGSRLKMAVNAWILTVVAGTAQSVALTRDLGLDPQLFLDTISGGATDSAYAQLKGKAMISGQLDPAFGLDGAVKDTALVADALRAAGDTPMLMDAVHRLMAAAADAGHGHEDMAAVLHAFRG